MKKKVVIFEDNKTFAQSLQAYINTLDDMECPMIYSNPTFLEEALKTHSPDVVLMDIDMPNMTGIEGVRAIRELDKNLPIIMQTVFDQDEHIYNSILAGANGYILKKSGPVKYVEALRSVVNGGAPMTESIAARVLDLVKSPPKSKQEDFNLSPRELEILTELVNGLSYKMIASKLEISYHTVNSHVKKIYDKLHVHNATEAVQKAIRGKIVSISAFLTLLSSESILFDIFTRCLEA